MGVLIVDVSKGSDLVRKPDAQWCTEFLHRQFLTLSVHDPLGEESPEDLEECCQEVAGGIQPWRQVGSRRNWLIRNLGVGTALPRFQARARCINLVAGATENLEFLPNGLCIVLGLDSCGHTHLV